VARAEKVRANPRNPANFGEFRAVRDNFQEKKIYRETCAGEILCYIPASSNSAMRRFQRDFASIRWAIWRRQQGRCGVCGVRRTAGGEALLQLG